VCQGKEKILNAAVVVAREETLKHGKGTLVR
jgi:hypothetical protein